jgi:AcrR family transcriptional regulator
MAARRVADHRPQADRLPRTKGERTRERIVREAAQLFNTYGFSGTSVADVSAATQLEKGGVYNHFESKDALALACFDYAAGLVLDRIQKAVEPHASAWNRIQGLFEVYRQLADRSFVKGGCPILNTAVEADDTHPALAGRVRRALDAWRGLLKDIIDKGVADGELQTRVSSDEIATAMIAGLEGGVMLSKLYRDASFMRTMVQQLTIYLHSVVQAQGR